MATVTSTQTPLIRKSDAWGLQAVANARKYKTVLELRDRQGLSWREIAERMNYSECYIRRTYTRANMILGTEEKSKRYQHSSKTKAERAKTAAAAIPFIRGEEMSFIRGRIRLEKYRTVIALREEYPLTFREISERMGFSKSYVKALYYKAVSVKQQAREHGMKAPY